MTRRKEPYFTELELDTLAFGYPWPRAQTLRALRLAEQEGLPFGRVVDVLDMQAHSGYRGNIADFMCAFATQWKH